jgi:hypothetical protein
MTFPSPFLSNAAVAKLSEMALERLGIETLETRNSDGLDFHDVAVWQIRDLLARAYAMGAADAVSAA